MNNLIKRNLSGLTLEELGYLLMLAKGINPEQVFSSKVTLEVAKEGFVAKGILKLKQQEG